MRRKSPFTLLEVVAAMLILALGIGLTMRQLAVSSARQEANLREWDRTHELAQAAEYLLLEGGTAVEPRFLRDAYRVEAEYRQLEQDDAIGELTLRQLQIRLVENGEVVDELNIDTWVRENVHGH